MRYPSNPRAFASSASRSHTASTAAVEASIARQSALPCTPSVMIVPKHFTPFTWHTLIHSTVGGDTNECEK